MAGQDGRGAWGPDSTTEPPQSPECPTSGLLLQGKNQNSRLVNPPKAGFSVTDPTLDTCCKRSFVLQKLLPNHLKGKVPRTMN